MVALSNTKAEYMTISHAMHIVLYLRMLQKEMGIDPNESGALLLEDNQLSIKLA